ncbi:SDR family oxidoreductase [Lacisediminihabitans sp. H27-G8]|uniref:SDR family oxidoreductase n=1 Tax=Lacisediminihabitans sp. H27-G8 TaxID=3111909 RepID=UPI0038FCEACD
MANPSSKSRAEGRTVLVTGTSSGIGMMAAVALAKAGWITVATMRTLARSSGLEDAAAVAGVSLDIRELDVTDSVSISTAVEEIIASHGRLDALVNNAGAASVGTIEQMDIEGYRAAMEVNYFGVVQLTKAALPHLRETRGRVVTISSVGGAIGQPFNEAYCAAKFAVEGFMESLHPVAKTVGVDICIVEPGAVASEFVANAGLDPEAMLSAAGPYAPALSAYLDRTLKQFDPSSAQSPGEVADKLVESLEITEPVFRVQTSAWARDFVSTKLVDLDGSRVTELTATWVN